jgi:hypothetical protein
MKTSTQQWEETISILESMHQCLQGLLESVAITKSASSSPDYVHVPFKGSEIYLLEKAFLDAGGAPNDNYKTLFEKTMPHIANKTQKGFSVQSICKYSDKVDHESRENVKRFLQKMIRNIDSYD